MHDVLSFMLMAFEHETHNMPSMIATGPEQDIAPDHEATNLFNDVAGSTARARKSDTEVEEAVEYKRFHEFEELQS